MNRTATWVRLRKLCRLHFRRSHHSQKLAGVVIINNLLKLLTQGSLNSHHMPLKYTLRLRLFFNKSHTINAFYRPWIHWRFVAPPTLKAVFRVCSSSLSNHCLLLTLNSQPSCTVRTLRGCSSFCSPNVIVHSLLRFPAYQQGVNTQTPFPFAIVLSNTDPDSAFYPFPEEKNRCKP